MTSPAPIPTERQIKLWFFRDLINDLDAALAGHPNVNDQWWQDCGTIKRKLLSLRQQAQPTREEGWRSPGPVIKPQIIADLREWAEFEQDGGNVEQGAAIDIILDWYDRQIGLDTRRSPAPEPKQGDGPRLTAYETQVLIGTSISGCTMSPSDTFDLKAAWSRLHVLGLIDRTDGLAIATPAGGEHISRIVGLRAATSTESRE